MYTKSQRQEIIRATVAGGTFHKQDELAAALQAKGLDITQCTLSRDLKEMGIMRKADPGQGYLYVLPGEDAAHAAKVPAKSIGFSSQVAVIKTEPGFASAVAAVIDNGDVDGVLGTIAGDDTILVIIREGFSQHQVITNLSRHITISK